MTCGFILLGTWPPFFPSSQKKKKKSFFILIKVKFFLLSNEYSIDQVCWSR